MALAVTSAIWQQVNSPALDIRRFISAGMQEGVVGINDMAVAQRGAGANYSVDIPIGEALVRGDTVTNQALYYVYNDATSNLTGFTAAHATLPRIDRVTLRVRDAFHGDAANDASFQIVTGTATSGATLVNLNGAAAVPNSSLLLANILIPATATTITTANIDTTVRPRSLAVAANLITPGTSGQVLTTSSGVSTWVTPAVTTLQYDYKPVTSNQTSTATTAAGATAVITGNAVAYDGATTVEIVGFIPYVQHSIANLNIYMNLYDGSTDMGRVASVWETTTGSGSNFMRGSMIVTPTAATHTYSVRLWSSGAGTITAFAGTGGVGADAPMYLRVSRAA